MLLNAQRLLPAACGDAGVRFSTGTHTGGGGDLLSEWWPGAMVSLFGPLGRN